MSPDSGRWLRDDHAPDDESDRAVFDITAHPEGSALVLLPGEESETIRSFQLGTTGHEVVIGELHREREPIAAALEVAPVAIIARPGPGNLRAPEHLRSTHGLLALPEKAADQVLPPVHLGRHADVRVNRRQGGDRLNEIVHGSGDPAKENRPLRMQAVDSLGRVVAVKPTDEIVSKLRDLCILPLFHQVAFSLFFLPSYQEGVCGLIIYYTFQETCQKNIRISPKRFSLKLNLFTC